MVIGPDERLDMEDMLQADIHDLKRENARLRAIVDKLPVTADFMRITDFGDTVYLWNIHGERGVLQFESQVGWAVWPELGKPAAPEWPKAPFDCYSTPEAAAAALKQSEADNEQ